VLADRLQILEQAEAASREMLLGITQYDMTFARALIVTDEGPVMSYFEFTGVICQLNTALQVIMQIVHSIRMAATEPYG
jgi:hypothetical protein